MEKNNFLILILLLLFVPAAHAEDQEDYKILREIVINEFKKEAPSAQSANMESVLSRFKTTEKKAAIVLGACLDQGTEIDQELFTALSKNQIPVSLFVDQGWLKKNSNAVKKLISTGSVALENHGLFCRPLSVTGMGVQNHPGTTDVDEAFEEVEKNAREIEAFSGRLPRFYKAGYDFYDDVTLKMISVLGYTAIQGDLKLRARDTESDLALKTFLDQIQPGSIILMPANRPGTSAEWLPKLLGGISARGYEVSALDDVVNIEENL